MEEVNSTDKLKVILFLIKHSTIGEQTMEIWVVDTDYICIEINDEKNATLAAELHNEIEIEALA